MLLTFTMSFLCFLSHFSTVSTRFVSLGFITSENIDFSKDFFFLSVCGIRFLCFLVLKCYEDYRQHVIGLPLLLFHYWHASNMEFFRKCLNNKTLKEERSSDFYLVFLFVVKFWETSLWIYVWALGTGEGSNIIFLFFCLPNLIIVFLFMSFLRPFIASELRVDPSK